MTKKFLSREDILSRKELRTLEVYVPVWDAHVRVRELTAAERDYFEAMMLSAGGKTNIDNVRARLCVLSLVDENGARLFRDGEEAVLGQYPAAALDVIFQAALEVNGLTPVAKEEAAKNS